MPTSAKDDAAGQAIANRMTSQITGLSQAQRNANDGISVAQTTEGALNQVNDNLQRIRELSVQAQNGTNSEKDLTSIQNEIGQRLNEINRISEETSFNGVKVLQEDNSLKIQVGANDGETIEINLQQINAETLGLGKFSVSGAKAATADDLAAAGLNEVETVDGVTTYNTTVNSKATAADAVSAANLTVGTDGTDSTNVTVDGTTTYVAASTTSFTNTKAVDDATTSAKLTPTTGFNEVSVNFGSGLGTDTTVKIDSEGNLFNEGGDALTYDTATNAFAVAGDGDTQAKINSVVTDLSNTDGDTIVDGNVTYAATAAGYDATTTLSTDQLLTEMKGKTVQIDQDGTSTAGAGTTYDISETGSVTQGGSTTYANATTGVLTQADGGTDDEYFVQKDGTVQDSTGATVYMENEVLTTDPETKSTANPLEALDSALSQVDALRSDLGAIQNRFDSAITNLATTETNLSSARSRIEDADYASEVANMTRAQILQQAGTSVLAQANQLPQSVLSLLG